MIRIHAAVCLLALLSLVSAAGCGATPGPNLGLLAYPVPVSPYFQDCLEDRAWEQERYDRVAILGPLTAGGPAVALDPPSEAAQSRSSAGRPPGTSSSPRPSAVTLVATFAALAFGYQILLSVSGVILELLTFRVYPRTSDYLKLIGFALVEPFGFRQLTVWWRLKGIGRFLLDLGGWNVQERYGFEEESASAGES